IIERVDDLADGHAAVVAVQEVDIDHGQAEALEALCKVAPDQFGVEVSVGAHVGRGKGGMSALCDDDDLPPVAADAKDFAQSALGGALARAAADGGFPGGIE